MTDEYKSNSEQEKMNEKTKIKKNYRPPQFEVYGSLTALTKGSLGKANDGAPKTSRPA